MSYDELFCRDEPLAVPFVPHGPPSEYALIYGGVCRLPVPCSTRPRRGARASIGSLSKPRCRCSATGAAPVLGRSEPAALVPVTRCRSPACPIAPRASSCSWRTPSRAAALRHAPSAESVRARWQTPEQARLDPQPPCLIEGRDHATPRLRRTSALSLSLRYVGAEPERSSGPEPEGRQPPTGSDAAVGG